MKRRILSLILALAMLLSSSFITAFADGEMTEPEIVDAAFALETGKALSGTFTLTGVVSQILTPYDEGFANVTVNMTVLDGAGAERTIQCYRMKGDDAATVEVGDTIAVTGKIKNYKGTVEFDANCTFETVSKAGGAFAIKTFAGYASGDVALLVRQEGKTTIESITGKDYNAYALIVCNADGKVIDLDLRGPGRPAGVKGDYEIPQGGFIIGINRDVTGYPIKVVEEAFVLDGIELGSRIKLYGVDLADLAETANGTALTASFNVLERLPETEAEILAAAFALEAGGQLEGTYSLTGKVTEKTDTNRQVKIAVADKEILCFKMVEADYNAVAVDDIVTVTGVLKNYQGTVEYDTGCTAAVIHAAAKEDVPEGAVTIDSAQGWRGDICVIYVPLATGENTLGTVTGVTTGKVQDCTWWNAIVVDAEGKVVKKIGMTDKTNEEIPAGGYILAAHGSSPALAVLASIESGSTITLYNCDIAAFATLGVGIDLTQAAFTITEPVVERPASYQKTYELTTASGTLTYWNADKCHDDGTLLTDGKKGSLIGDQTGYNVAISGLSLENPVLITIDLGEAKWVHKFVTYNSANTGWGIAGANSVKVSYSLDGTTFKSAGEVTGAGTIYEGTGSGWTCYEHALELAKAVSARYVRFEITSDGNHKFLWIEEAEVWEGEEPAPDPFPVYPDTLWEIFDKDTAQTIDGVTAGKFQGSDSDCGDAFSYVYAYDSEYVYVAVVTNYAGIGSADNFGNGKGTNIRLWFRTNDEATVYTHFVDIEYDGDDVPALFAKKCGDLNANANTVEISTEGVIAEAVAGEGTLFMQAKIPFSVIEAASDFGFFVTVSNGKTDTIVNHAIIAPYDADCVFAKDGMDRTKNNTYFPYTSWNDAAIVVPVAAPVEPITENILDLEELKILDVITFTADDPSIGTVRVYGSVDGEEYYDLNAGGAAKVDATTGVASVALTTQGYIQVRYIKVEGTDVHGTISATFKAADEGAFIAPPAGPYDFGLKEDNAYCIVMLENRVVDINAVKGDDYVVAPKNNQLIITQKVANGVYKIIANSVNAWPNQGHPELITAGIEGLNIDEEGIITLADDQFAFVIVSSGSIKTAGDEQTAPAKRIDRGLGTNGYFRVEGDKLTLHVYEPEAVEEPEVPVVEPGKYAIKTFAGYAGGDVSIVVRQEGKTTIGEVTGKDYNYYRVILVDSDGFVTEVLETLGRAEVAHSEGDGRKDLVVIPEGGFAIGIHNDAIVADGSVYADLFGEGGVKAGDQIELIGVDLAALATTAAQTVLEGASFNVIAAEEPVVEPYEATVIVKDNAILTDGKTGFDGAWGTVGTGDVLLVSNPQCTTAPMVVTVIDELDELQTIKKVSLDLYHDANVMIGYPEGKATVYVSADGVDYTLVGEFDLVAANVALGSHGTVSSAFEFEAEAKFIKIVLNVGSNAAVLGDSPADGKVNWEFISIAEITVEGEEEPVVDPLAPEAYLWLSTGSAGVPGLTFSLPGELFADDYVMDIEALVMFEGCESNGGSAYLNCYPYNGSQLLTWGDYAKHGNYEQGVWQKVVKSGWKLSKNGLDPDTVNLGVGFYLATGTIKLGYIKVSHAGEVVWSIDFTEGFNLDDEKLIMHTNVTEATKGVAWDVVGAKERIQPFVLEEVPEGAIAIDYAGYKHAGVVSILAGDGQTVAELTARGNNGTAKDLNYAYNILVNADNVVIATDYALGVACTFEVPEGGYIISYNGNKAGYAVMADIAVGATIYVGNVNINAVRTLEGNVELESAFFTYENPAVERPISFEKSYTVAKAEGAATYWSNANISLEDDGRILTDGKKGSLDGASHSYVALNGLGGAAGVITVDLGEAAYVDTFKTYTTANAGWGIPQAKYIVVSYSLDGETFTQAGVIEGDGEIYAGTGEGWTSYEHSLKLDSSVSARYVKFEVTTWAAFLWIEEVEVWEGEEPVSTETVIDGKFNDSIWADTVWTLYDGYNVGTWQQYQKKGTYTYNTALVEDDDYIYFAGLVDTTGVTQIRVWFRTNPEAALYTHFIDVFSDGRHFIKKNQSLTENSGKEIEATFEYALVEKDGKTYVEIKAAKADLEIDGDFEFIPQASVDGFSNLLGAEIVHGNFEFGGKTMTYFPWVHWPELPEDDYVGLIPVTNHWIFTDIDYGGNVGVINKAHYERQEDGHLRFVVGGTANWPLVTYYYEEAKVYNVERGTLNYKFTTDRCNTNITFIFEDADGVTYSFPLANTALGLEEGQYDKGSGDIRPGTYEGSIALSDLIASTALLGGTEFPEADATELRFTGIIIYACGITDPAGGVYVDDLSVTVEAAPEVNENVIDLGEVVAITGLSFHAANPEGLETVEILGSVDGVNYYRLNSEPAVTVTDGVATLNSLTGSNHRMFLNVRYIKIVGEPNVEGTVELDEVEEGINPEGPYTATGLGEKGYGIVIWTAEDAPDGFGVNDKGYTSNGKTLNLNSAMITIAEEIEEGVYKILWNDSNGWSKETGAAHLNTPEGVDGVDYRDEKVYLKENQIVIFTMSSGAYETAGDGEYSNAKWILRGIVSGGFIKLGEGTISVYVEKPEAEEVDPRVEVADFDGDGKISSDDAIYLLRATLFAEDYPINIRTPFYGDKKPSSDDAIYLLRATLFPKDYPLVAE